MKYFLVRVNQYDRVSSKCKAKTASLVFSLGLIALLAFFSLDAKNSAASDVTPEKIVELTNQSRLEKGLKEIIVNQKLMLAAEAKSDDMAENGYFSHTSPSGKTPWSWIGREDYDYNFAGENLAMDFQSAEKMEEAWMKSPTHRANILNNKYREIGVAVRSAVVSGHETILAVVMFGSGDKGERATENPEGEKTKEKTKAASQDIFPALPVAEARKKQMDVQAPIILSPQNGQVTAASDLEIAGLSRPGKIVFVYDEEKFVGSGIADSGGRFEIQAKDFSDGEHRLFAKEEEVFSQNEVLVKIDTAKPEIEYRLYAGTGNSRQLFVAVKSNEKNCSLDLVGEKRNVASGEPAIFALRSRNTSAVIRVYDEAGNKAIRQVSIANYYFEKNRNTISENLASVFPFAENIFAVESGRKAVRENLGIASREPLSMRAKNGS